MDLQEKASQALLLLEQGQSGQSISDSNGNENGSSTQQSLPRNKKIPRKNPLKEKPRSVRASKLEYVKVDQIWDKGGYGTMLVAQLNKAEDEDLYEEYIFVERRKYDYNNRNYRTFVDVKSEALRDKLRQIMEGVNSISLRANKPEIPIEALFHFLPQLEECRDQMHIDEDKGRQHVELLVGYLQCYFKTTLETLPQLLKHGEITFDLLWALIPPNAIVFSICDDSEEPRCSIAEFGVEKKTSEGKSYFLRGHYIGFDGKRFANTPILLEIKHFPGSKQITSLEAFPLEYHKSYSELRPNLIQRGHQFERRKGVHHCAYNGLVHFKTDKSRIKITVRGRFMIDASSFKEQNPNYEALKIQNSASQIMISPTEESPRSSPGVSSSIIITEAVPLTTDEDFLICSPTVLGFSFDRSIWAEFAVSCIEDIHWTNLPFQNLVMPVKKKDMLQALVLEHTAGTAADEASFDDVVKGKGRGLIILLHGPPGVGKTLTAEAISEFRHRPLYRVTAGDLGLDSEKLETKLEEILDLVARWNAILLLDEADVFLESRERQHIHQNALVSVFLRRMEYFQGVMILTTNRVTTFDEAVQSRIHVGIRYEALTREAKEEIWKAFLKQSIATGKTEVINITLEQLRDLSKKDFNGRQIKNTVRMAHALAVAKDVPLGYEHLVDAIEANQDFDDDFRGGSGHKDAMKFYQ